jgi:hypothetical protein
MHLRQRADVRNNLAVAAVLTLLCASAVSAAVPPPFPNWPKNSTRVSINEVVDGEPHTVELNRGIVVRRAAKKLILREADDSRVTVRLSGATIVSLDSHRSTIAAIRKGITAETMTIDGGPAVRVRAFSRTPTGQPRKPQHRR